MATPDALYFGEMDAQGNAQAYKMIDGLRHKLSPRFDLANHSPTGFQWGYGGSGPAQLALAIMADYLQNADNARTMYQYFKNEVIARFPMGKPWTLTDDQVRAWLQKHASE